MIVDGSTLLSNAQAITATAPSANTIDLGLPATPPLVSQPIPFKLYSYWQGRIGDLGLAISVVEAFNNLTSLAIAVETAMDAAFTSPNELSRSAAYTLAQLAGGRLLPDRLPNGTYQRFVRLKYYVTGTAPTTGRITAAFSDVQATRIN